VVLLVRSNVLVALASRLARLRFRTVAPEGPKMAGIKVIQHSKGSVSWRDYNSSPSACRQATDLPLSSAMSGNGEQPVNEQAETPPFPAFAYLFTIN
jgi:hypothetical protein